MNMNKIPDKIYMPNELLSEEWQRHIEGEDTAYIRKDALLEWAKKEMGKWSSESNTAQGVKMGITLVLDKIESL